MKVLSTGLAKLFPAILFVVTRLCVPCQKQLVPVLNSLVHLFFVLCLFVPACAWLLVRLLLQTLMHSPVHPSYHYIRNQGF